MDVFKANTSNATKLSLIKDYDRVLSLGLIAEAEKMAEAEKGEELPEEVAKLVEERANARKEKNFALADELRDKISEMGYIIEETRQGTKVTKK